MFRPGTYKDTTMSRNRRLFYGVFGASFFVYWWWILTGDFSLLNTSERGPADAFVALCYLTGFVYGIGGVLFGLLLLASLRDNETVLVAYLIGSLSTAAGFVLFGGGLPNFGLGWLLMFAMFLSLSVGSSLLLQGLNPARFQLHEDSYI